MSGINATYLDSDTLTISGSNYINDFNPGRRVKASCGVDGDKYGWVLSSAYDDPLTTVNLTDDSDAITDNLTEVYVAQVDVGHDNRYYTSAQVDTISGTIVAQIPDDFYSQAEITTISGNIVAQIPTDFYTTGEVDTISGSLNTKIEAKADYLFGDNTFSGTGTIITGDHGTATTAEVVNTIYGTGDAPAAAGYSEGAVYIKYTA